MKLLRFILLYLYIYIINPTFLNAQNLTLKIIGKDTVESTIIDSLNYKARFIDYASLKKEVESFYLKIQKSGYIESEHVSISKKNDSLYVSKIHLNKKFNNLYIYYNTNYITTDLLSEISTHFTRDYFSIPILESEDVLVYLNKKLAEKGMPFISFQLNNITKLNNNDLKGRLIVSSTNTRMVDNIIIKGYKKFPESFLNRYLKLKISQPFNLTTIKQKSEGLNNLSFAKQIKEPEILFAKDSTTLYLYIEKSKSNTFDGFLGFGNNESTNKIKFNGYLNLKLNNNLNFGETFSLIYKSDENNQRTFNVSTNLPYIFKSPVGTYLSLEIFRKDSTFNTVNQSAKLFYQINNKNKFLTGVNFINSTYLLENNNAHINDYTSTFFTGSYEYTYATNDKLFPIDSYFSIHGGFGNRKMEHRKEKQTSFKFKVLKLFNLNTKNSIYFNLNGEGLFSDTLLTNELKRFGGINSIRGFEENSLFASLYTVMNSEYRYKLNSNIYIHTIFDAAYYENEINNTKEKLFGFGFGFGLITNAGLLKFNFANGVFENQVFKLDDSKIHLSLSAFF